MRPTILLTGFAFLASSFLVTNAATVVDSPIVVTDQGQLIGVVTQSAKGRDYYSFRGIPYALPPVGDLRFKPTQPSGPWDGLLNATHDVNRCAQLGVTIGTEDCLYLNIYTPYLPGPDGNVSLPVMVFIHGGGFASGEPTSIVYGGQRFLDHDVLLVTIAYRLGPFGFLSTGDANAAGNYGLLDQMTALKWVQSNIAPFGGDKDRVTIFGESAGAASVLYHVLSPVSSGLFRAALAESGSAMCGFALQTDPLYWASKLAEALECPTLTTAELVDCIKQKTTEEIVDAANSIKAYSIFYYPFVPVLESVEYGQFLTELPVKILEDQTFNKVPVLAGVNKNEGDLCYAPQRHLYDVIDDNFFDNILPQLVYMWTKITEHNVNVSYAIKAEYYDKIDLNDSLEVTRTSIDLNSDAMIKYANDITLRRLADGGLTTYMYSFEYHGSGSYYNFTGTGDVSHADEIYYLFNLNSFTPEDQYISDYLIEFWTNFATYLDPTPAGSDVQWLPTKDTVDLDYLEIQEDSLTMQSGYRNEQMNFWETVVPSIVFAN